MGNAWRWDANLHADRTAIAEITWATVRTRRQCLYFRIRLYCGGTVILSISGQLLIRRTAGDLPGNRRISFRAGRGRGNDRSDWDGWIPPPWCIWSQWKRFGGSYGNLRRPLMELTKRHYHQPKNIVSGCLCLCAAGAVRGFQELSISPTNQGLNMNSCQQVLNQNYRAEQKDDSN